MQAELLKVKKEIADLKQMQARVLGLQTQVDQDGNVDTNRAAEIVDQ